MSDLARDIFGKDYSKEGDDVGDKFDFADPTDEDEQ